MALIFRKNRQFIVNVAELKPKAIRVDIINGLYAAIYSEFKGASENNKYKNLTPLELMAKLNEFAYQWLKDRGLN